MLESRMVGVWLLREDSNLDNENQNLVSCH